MLSKFSQTFFVNTVYEKRMISEIYRYLTKFNAFGRVIFAREPCIWIEIC